MAESIDENAPILGEENSVPPEQESASGKPTKKQRIEWAKQELAKMTPEEYVGVTDYIEELERTVDNTKMPEVPYVSLFEMRSSQGVLFKMTARSYSLIGLFENIVKDIPAISERFKIELVKLEKPPMSAPSAPAPSAPAPTGAVPAAAQAPAQQPQPEYVPDAQKFGGKNLERMVVKTIFTDTTTKGDLYLRCRAGMFTKFGVAAYEQVIPPDIFAQMANWPLKKEFQPPAELSVIWVDMDSKKVAKFGD